MQTRRGRDCPRHPCQYLQCELSEPEGEATVFGKVRRIIPRGQQQDVFSIMPTGVMGLPNVTATQRQKMLREMVQKGLVDVIKGTAIILTPVAIYR